MTVNLKDAHEEFSSLKRQNANRNYEYYLLREAVRGNFRWPRDWPAHIPKVKHNLCKPITERFATYLMGKGFTYNVDRPNTLEYRDSAERAEKILAKLLDLSDSKLQFEMGAKTGSQLGRTIFKVYKQGKKGVEHACFSYCQPDYFYGIPSGDGTVGDFSVVYYSYPLDKLEAKRRFGDGNYKTELELDSQRMYDVPSERSRTDSRIEQQRNVPVLEVWTKDSYALEVGGVVKFNGDNPNKWSDTGEGFTPFVVIENIRNAGDGFGESDIGQARELNELLNYTISRKLHIVSRWLQPTLVWEGAPQNYAQVLTQTLGGGGAIPARLGARLYFLAYDRPNPAVQEIELSLRQSILETAGMNEIAMQGTVQGSINTGPALQAQFQPVLSTIEKKRTEWEYGLERLFAMLLQKQEDIGDSKALGQAVINRSVKSETVLPVTEQDPGANTGEGELVALSGKDINGLRRAQVSWPGVLPKDDTESANMEIAKAEKGFQSIYTTLEKLGEEYPDDEIARIRMENQDPTLRGQQVAEQMRSQAPLLRAHAQMAQQVNDMAAQPAEGELPPEEEAPVEDPNSIAARLRQFAQQSQPQLDPDMETIASGAPVGY
jgi:hypothetical protein